MKELKNVEAGDIVVCDGELRRVSRVTKTLAVVERKNGVGKVWEEKYNKHTGYKSGEAGSMWGGRRHIRIPKEREIEELMERDNRRRLARKIDKLHLDQIPSAALESMLRIAQANQKA